MLRVRCLRHLACQKGRQERGGEGLFEVGPVLRRRWGARGGRRLATGRGGRYATRRGLSRRVACSLVRVSIGIEGRWVMGCSSCWTAVRRECWWSSLGESRSYNVAGWVDGEWVVGFVSTVFTDKTEEVYLHRG